MKIYVLSRYNIFSASETSKRENKFSRKLKSYEVRAFVHACTRVQGSVGELTRYIYYE